MAPRSSPGTRGEGFAVQGEVVEILERDGERRVKVMLKEAPVVDLPLGGLREVHLGDQVLVEGSLAIEAARHTLPDAPPRERPRQPGGASPVRRKAPRRG